jgi:hypothetical protein
MNLKKIENKELSKARDSCLILSSQKERNEKTKKQIRIGACSKQFLNNLC